MAGASDTRRGGGPGLALAAAILVAAGIGGVWYAGREDDTVPQATGPTEETATAPRGGDADGQAALTAPADATGGTAGGPADNTADGAPDGQAATDATALERQASSGDSAVGGSPDMETGPANADGGSAASSGAQEEQEETVQDAAGPGVTPSFDLVRADPGGTTVVAGRAAPASDVAVLLDGEEIARAETGPDGSFYVILDIPPAEAPRVVSLRAELGDGETAISGQSVILASPRLAPDGGKTAAGDPVGAEPLTAADGNAGTGPEGDGAIPEGETSDNEDAGAARGEDLVADAEGAGTSARAGGDPSTDAGTRLADLAPDRAPDRPVPDREAEGEAGRPMGQSALDDQATSRDAETSDAADDAAGPGAADLGRAGGTLAEKRPADGPVTGAATRARTDGGEAVDAPEGEESDSEAVAGRGDAGSDDAGSASSPGSVTIAQGDAMASSEAATDPTLVPRGPSVGAATSDGASDEDATDTEGAAPDGPSGPTPPGGAGDDGLVPPREAVTPGQMRPPLPDTGTSPGVTTGQATADPQPGSESQGTLSGVADAPDTPAADTPELTARGAPDETAPGGEPSAPPEGVTAVGTAAEPAPGADPGVSATAPQIATPGTGAEGDPLDRSARPDGPGPRVLMADSGGIRVVQDPGTPPEVQQSVSIDTISYDDAGEVTLGGRGRGARFVRVYLDNAPVRTAQIAPDGQWRAELPQVGQGTYTLRVDEVDDAGQVFSRAETPFRPEDPETLENLAKARKSGDVQVVTVQPGFTLWRIARENYGEGILYVRVFEANADKIRDPDLIYPGQIFTVPEGEEAASANAPATSSPAAASRAASAPAPATSDPASDPASDLGAAATTTDTATD
ncbi:LysM peptidoglycan-binding domain-containing protein [Mesobaculum littorinae]|uniref:LysM peptidoglycan-binding domain-containing protein n=1 Tax=Mesobaculum littorinae TaxID=2486419 RepID=A0A438AJB6_9RHOB|nr:LysM peptidoglycan-binding domain-containing protein [Mesobaculum littorinae]RVV98772.1 LysM peptidoglycan-binding domain-containing protein [Mesobaculum littorinae]